MTPKEFDATPPNCFKPGFRYEIINGVLVVSPPVSIAESDPNDELGYLLRTYQETSPEGKALDRTVPERYVPGTPNRRRCDRAIWTGLGRIPDVDHDVPSIVVEFVSSRKRDALRDYEDKRDEYLAAGVKEYWIIDRFRRIMTIYRPGLAGPTYDIVREAESYQTPLLPGFALPLGRLLAKADDWTRAKRQQRRHEHKPNPPSGGNDG
jgi:Uma2 family endonuclease